MTGVERIGDILYVNGQYRGDSAIGRLMHDFSCWNPDDMKCELLRDAARYYKENPKGVETMCRAFEQTRNEGAKRRAMDIAMNLIEQGQLTLEVIASVTELPLEEVKKLAKELSAQD